MTPARKKQILRELRAYRRFLKRVWSYEPIPAVQLANAMNRVDALLKELR